MILIIANIEPTAAPTNAIFGGIHPFEQKTYCLDISQVKRSLTKKQKAFRRVVSDAITDAHEKMEQENELDPSAANY